MTPCDALDEFDKISDCITRLLADEPNAEIVIAGDFNVHNVTWLRHSSTSDLVGEYVELFSTQNNLIQLVSEPTRVPDKQNEKSHLLDLFLTSHPSKYVISVHSPLGTSDHCLISASFPIASANSGNTSTPKRIVWHYNQADWEGLQQFFKVCDWKKIFRCDNIDSIATSITNTIMEGMKIFIPYDFKAKKSKINSWFNKTCSKAINVKNQAFQKYIQLNTAEAKQAYVAARNACKSILKNEQFKHDQNIRQSVTSDSNCNKNFWSLVSKIKNNFSTSSVPTLIHNDNIYNTSIDKANLLASQFASNSRIPTSSQSPPPIRPLACKMSNIFFRERVVRKVLSRLDVKKATGPDGIPPLVLSRCASSLAKPLCKLFYLSYFSGNYPSVWKLAHVQPVPKKGDSSNPSNYRPIAITSILSKVMETIINFKLMQYLEKENIIHDRQYGFRSKRSTGDLTTYVTEIWHKSIHGFGETEVVALDISKAFDRVWHAALLAKLKAIGVSKALLKWIENFLTNRSIKVVIDGVASDSFSINAGVPQGSVLSPTLFLIFINDLLYLTFNPLHCFADDSTLSSSYAFESITISRSSSSETIRTAMIDSLNDDIEKIICWGRANRVEFNASKTQCCLISKKLNKNVPSVQFGGVNVSNSDQINLLGMTISSNAHWNDHIFKQAKEASKYIGFLKRCTKYFTPANLLTIYKSYIRPKLEYNSHVWAGAAESSLSILDRIQNSAIKLINDVSLTCKLDSLSHRRNVGSLSLFYRFYYGKCSLEIKKLIPPTYSFPRNTRTANNAHPHFITPIRVRTTQCGRTFINRTIKLWNALPFWVFPDSFNLNRFKQNIHRHLTTTTPLR